MGVRLQGFLWLIPFVACFYLSDCHDLGPTFVLVDSTEIEQTPFLGTTGQLESDLADNAILKPDGTVWAWGNNFTGQLGDGTMNPSAEPKQIPTLKHIISIDFCEGGALALAHNGSVWFWGNRLLWEELPPELDTTVTIPRKIGFLPGAVQVLASVMDFYLLRDDGTVWVLHWNNYYPTRFLTPERVARRRRHCRDLRQPRAEEGWHCPQFPYRLRLGTRPWLHGSVDAGERHEHPEQASYAFSCAQDRWHGLVLGQQCRGGPG